MGHVNVQRASPIDPMEMRAAGRDPAAIVRGAPAPFNREAYSIYADRRPPFQTVAHATPIRGSHGIALFPGPSPNCAAFRSTSPQTGAGSTT